MELKGKIGIVTGASSGLGRAISLDLVRQGAIVYAISRRGKAQDQMEDPEGLIHVKGDVTDYSAMKLLIDKIGQERGLDFLINNAGMTIKKRAEEISLSEMRNIQEINVNAPYFLSCYAYPYLKKAQQKGRIIQIASMAAHLGFSEVVPYCITKSAVLGLVRGLAVEWRNDNILVNSISPGWFPSELTQQVMDEDREQKIKRKIALNDFGHPKDIAAMVSFLVSDQAQYITGQDYAVDGGALSFGY